MSTDTIMETMAIGKRLVELCNEGKNRQAIEELYADDAVAIEAMAGGPKGREVRGKEDLLAGCDWFFNAFEIHGGEIQSPYPLDDRFICRMTIDVTGKEGPMAGQRMLMEEACLYTVKDGKITRSEFFYAPGPDCG